jgi:preprotein translocase subunit SecE
VARDRKRSRQRRPKRVREEASVPAQGRVVRGDLPGQLDHVGDVDEFDAALVRGAEGVPAESLAAAELAEDQQEREQRAPGKRASKDGRGNGSVGGEAALPARRPSQPIGARVGAFLRASWAELQRVQWPDRRQVTQATAVVLGFVAVMGIYLGVADWAAQKIVNFII